MLKMVMTAHSMAVVVCGLLVACWKTPMMGKPVLLPTVSTSLISVMAYRIVRIYPNPAIPLMTTDQIMALGILTEARCVSSDIWTTLSTPAKAKAGVRNPMQKLTPFCDQPPALMKVCQTSAFDAFLLVARIAIMMMKK